MTPNETKRRLLLKGAVATGVVSVAVGAGLVTPRAVMAAYPKAAFEAKDVAGAVGATEDSDKIKIKAPDIAENGAVVPVTVSTDLPGVESITILAEKNPVPLAGIFNLSDSTEGYVSTRIKMGKTGDVVAVVAAGGKQYKAGKAVKVTIGGCGG